MESLHSFNKAMLIDPTALENWINNRTIDDSFAAIERESEYREQLRNTPIQVSPFTYLRNDQGGWDLLYAVSQVPLNFYGLSATHDLFLFGEEIVNNEGVVPNCTNVCRAQVHFTSLLLRLELEGILRNDKSTYDVFCFLINLIKKSSDIALLHAHGGSRLDNGGKSFVIAPRQNGIAGIDPQLAALALSKVKQKSYKALIFSACNPLQVALEDVFDIDKIGIPIVAFTTINEVEVSKAQILWPRNYS